MARRPEDHESRGPHSEGPLDWLKQPGQQPPQEPEATQPTPLGGRRAARAQREAESALAAGPPPATKRRRGNRDPRSATDPDPAGSEPAEPAESAQPRRSSQSRQSEPAGPSKAGPRRRHIAFWLTVAALLLALWSATAFLDSGNFLVAGLASVSPLVSIVALPVIAVGVGSKHLVPTVIAVLAALLPWTLVTGYVTAGPGRSTVGSSSTLRVMSVDGAQGRANAQEIVQIARDYSANIVVVTQLTSELAHQLTIDGLNLLGTAQWVQVPVGGGNGIGVWSGPQIDDLQPITELSRPGVDGAIDAGTNKVGISVVQLGSEPFRPGSAWHSDLVRLAARTAPVKPGFIIGDLNATPWQPAFRKLTKSGWRDAADVVGQGLRPTWPAWSPVPIAPLDHVLVSPGVGVSSSATAKIDGSRHRALIVTLVLPHAGG